MFKIEQALYTDIPQMAVCFVEGFFEKDIGAELIPFSVDLLNGIMSFSDLVFVAKSGDVIAGYEMNIEKV